MDAITVLQMFFKKMEIAYKNGTALQRNSDERRVWLVHASCIGFSKAVQQTMKVVVGVYIIDLLFGLVYKKISSNGKIFFGVVFLRLT